MGWSKNGEGTQGKQKMQAGREGSRPPQLVLDTHCRRSMSEREGEMEEREAGAHGTVCLTYTWTST
jgi:hypothetical protein